MHVVYTDDPLKYISRERHKIKNKGLAKMTFLNLNLFNLKQRRIQDPVRILRWRVLPK